MVSTSDTHPNIPYKFPLEIGMELDFLHTHYNFHCYIHTTYERHSQGRSRSRLLFGKLENAARCLHSLCSATPQAAMLNFLLRA